MPAVKTLIIDQQQRGLREMAEQPPRARLAQPRPNPDAGTPQRTVHTADNGTTLPGRLVRAEGAPASGDAAVDEAYAHLDATYKLFWNIYHRDSIDASGLPLVGSVHYGEDYDNAFWNGAQMVFGDGDGEVFNRFTVAVDIIGHELTHGVIDTEAVRHQRFHVEPSVRHHVEHSLEVALLGPADEAHRIIVTLVLVLRVIASGAVGARDLEAQLLLEEVVTRQLQPSHAH